MANAFLNLPAPAGDGTGAAVDTSTLGGEKTITVQDAFNGTVTIEISTDGGVTWGQVYTFITPGKKVLTFAANRMRVRRAGVPLINPGLPNIDVSAPIPGGSYLALPIGVSVNTAGLGTLHTVVAQNLIASAIVIQISDDGVQWATCMVFNTGGVKTKSFTSQFMRAIAPSGGSATVSVGAIADAEVDTDELVKATAADAMANYLSPKLAAGAGIAITVLNPGGNEQVEIASIGESNCFIFRPGSGLHGPTVFDDWTELETAKEAVRFAQGGGCFEVVIDDTLATPIVPAGGPYDYSDTMLRGIVHPTNPAGSVVLQVTDGASFTNLLQLEDITIDNRTTVSPCPIPPRGTLHLNNAYVSTDNGGTAAFWDTASIGAGELFIVILENFSYLAQTAIAPIINIANAGSFGLFLVGTGCGMGRGALTGIAGTTAIVRLFDPSSSYGDSAGFLGALTLSIIGTPRMSFNPDAGSAAAAAPIGLSPGDFARFDASGGPIAQTLPALPSGSIGNSKGRLLAVAEVSGSTGLSLSPAGGNTLNGGVAAFDVPPGGSVELISDGISNWQITAIYDRFGLLYQSATNIARLTTTAAIFITHSSIVTPAMIGTFRVIATALIDSQASMRCRLQNVTDAVAIPGGPAAQITPPLAADAVPVSFSGEVVFAGASKTIDMGFSDLPPGGQTAGMQASHIALWRVS